MTGYRIEWSGPARRDTARLSERVATAVVVFVADRLATNLQRLSKALGGDLAGYRGARNGDYRVLLRLDEDGQIALIVHVDHRAHV